jgi:CheY-like chemotaxis protein
VTPRKTVLLVEDDTDTRSALAAVLVDEGYAVVEARHGLEALERLRQLPSTVRVILLDLMMPVMDGIGFRRVQAGDPSIADIPVVIFSAQGNLGAQGESLGAEAVLRKPVDLDVVLDTVRRFCGPDA